MGPVGPVGPTTPDVTAKITGRLFVKFVVPVPVEDTKLTGNSQ